MLMHSIAICMVVVGMFGFGFSKLIEMHQVWNQKPQESKPQVIQEPEEKDDSWWKEIFDVQ